MFGLNSLTEMSVKIRWFLGGGCVGVVNFRKLVT